MENAAAKELGPQPPLNKLKLQPRDAPSECSLSIASKTFSEMKNQETSAPAIKETTVYTFKSYFVNSAPRLEDDASDSESLEENDE